MRKVVLGVALVVAVVAAALVALWPSARPRIDATVSVREALASDDARFARALAPRPFAFPADHGPHPDFRTEWWYYTGNLHTAAGRNFVGWDWFALQLDDGRELMLYLLRHRDGTIDPFSAGTLVVADGTTRALGPADVRVETLAHWTSPRSGVRYPARWRLSAP